MLKQQERMKIHPHFSKDRINNNLGIRLMMLKLCRLSYRKVQMWSLKESWKSKRLNLLTNKKTRIRSSRDRHMLSKSMTESLVIWKGQFRAVQLKQEHLKRLKPLYWLNLLLLLSHLLWLNLQLWHSLQQQPIPHLSQILLRWQSLLELPEHQTSSNIRLKAKMINKDKDMQ